MATVEIMSCNPIAGSWFKVNDAPRYEPGAKTAAAAETRRQELLAEAEAKESEREARRQERQRKIDVEAVSRAVAKATATPHFAGSLTFLKLINYKNTCPYFDEVFAEMKRLQDEADAAERDEEM